MARDSRRPRGERARRSHRSAARRRAARTTRSRARSHRAHRLHRRCCGRRRDGGPLVCGLGAQGRTLRGAPAALILIAFAGFSLLGLGLYGTVRTATGSSVSGLVAALGAVGSMATWTWIVNGGVYARVFAAGLAACACWAAARWLGSGSRLAFAMTALLLAAALASHQFVGAVFAFGIGIATLAHPRPGKLQRAATPALATFLLASPAIVPPLVRYGGFSSGFPWAGPGPVALAPPRLRRS